MCEVSIIGIDLPKRTIQVHGARSDGTVGYREKQARLHSQWAGRRPAFTTTKEGGNSADRERNETHGEVVSRSSVPGFAVKCARFCMQGLISMWLGGTVLRH